MATFKVGDPAPHFEGQTDALEYLAAPDAAEAPDPPGPDNGQLSMLDGHVAPAAPSPYACRSGEPA